MIQEFKESQTEVNSLLQLVAHTISNQVTDEIILSTGGDLLLGETGSKVKNSSPSCSINEKTPQMRVFILYRIYVICILLLHQQQNVDAVAPVYHKNVLN